jgi:hypothetical protein
MYATKVAALALVASFCVAQGVGCTSRSGERSGASGGASSGARASPRRTAWCSFPDSSEKARRAGEIASKVEGVKRVYNDIRIAPRA